MKFDKNIFLNYMKNSISENKDVSYMYRLYRTYSAIDTIIDSDVKKNEDKLKKYEDSVYTVNGEIIDDNKRINLALDSLFSTINKDTKNEEYLKEFLNLKNSINNLDLKEIENIMYAKKQISILQSKLNLKNTFFLATHEAFLDLYRNIYIKTVNDDNIKSNRR